MPNLNQMQAKGEIEVVGYCDQDETKAAQFLKNYGGKYSCCDATSMLADSSIEAVLIAVGHSRRARRVHGP